MGHKSNKDPSDELKINT
jgi:hypothetical protein